MSPTGVMSIVFTILILQGNQAQTIKPEQWCSSRLVQANGGQVLVQSVRMFQVECEPGFVTPLSSPSQSFVYRCVDGKLDKKMPPGCVEARIPYRKVGFQVLLLETNRSLDLCSNESKQRELASYYNKTVENTVSNIQRHKLYIVNCSTPKFPKDFVRIYAVSTKMLKQNVTSDLVPTGHAHVILEVFKLLIECMHELGYLIAAEVANATLVYHSNSSLIGYHCDDHLGLKVDAGTHVCVGCGKGFWMDPNKQCHPCGPGFYNPVETAVECLPCPVQYESGLWSADSIAGCFQTRREQFSMLSRLLDGFVVPAVYLLLLVVTVAVLHKQKRHVSMGRASRVVSSARSSIGFQGKGLTELTTGSQHRPLSRSVSPSNRQLAS